MASREYNIVVLGAGGVGKSAVTVQFVQGIFLNSYDPTIEDSYRRQMDVDGRSCTLEILDTAGVEQFTAMRELYIKNGQGFLLVYSVTDRSSLQELIKLREQVCRIKDNQHVPIVLVGNKADLGHARTVSFQEAKNLAHNWGTSSFYETSARTAAHIDDVFADIVRQIQKRESAAAATTEATAPEPMTPSSSSSGSSTSHGRNLSASEKQAHGRNFSIGALSTSDRRSTKRSSDRHSELPVSKGGFEKKKKKKSAGLCVIL
ncbi:ras family-domain-containing protein [Kockiozyma suomiensis]|uniref:ras family-domain-containing protein n=1 Tax=Kockiozyma suomiensis TaxID=1337062 RepID=UPI003343DC8D